MRWIVLFALTLFVGPVWGQTETQENIAEQPAVKNYFGLGLGLESRLEREVNPDFFQLQSLGHYYGILGRGIYSLLFELSRERQHSQSGAMAISTSTTSLAVWGRLELGSNTQWKTFATVGVGERVDKVSSVFESAADERSGVRKLLGAGIGISGIFWAHFQLDAEGRAIFIQDRKDPQLLALLKVGVQFGNY